MLSANTYQEVCWQLGYWFRAQEQEGNRQAVRMTGLLAAPPDVELVRSELLPRLGYFHSRSGEDIHVFCGGYGAYWAPGQPPDTRVACTAPHPREAGGEGRPVDWLFSDSYFNQFREEIEARSGWEYSGETDLILADAVYHPEATQLQEKASLDFRFAVVVRLAQAKDLAEAAGKRFTVGAFLEDICRYAKRQAGDSPVSGFFDPRRVPPRSYHLIPDAWSALPEDSRFPVRSGSPAVTLLSHGSPL
jgi:hypothetical protein